MPIEIDPDLIAQLRLLPKPDHRRVGAAIEAVRANWEQPHLHGGVGIRRLAPNLYESRAGLCFLPTDDCQLPTFLRSHFPTFHLPPRRAGLPRRSETKEGAAPRVGG